MDLDSSDERDRYLRRLRRVHVAERVNLHSAARTKHPFGGLPCAAGEEELPPPRPAAEGWQATPAHGFIPYLLRWR
jgi:hypothetical protein